ncbi:MAG: Asp-tRNA(Asn)/Glu-tRNA(Gln) amidotransferase subunit GatC [Dethiobacteria bacterium]|nr:Asp-tRNA(Asn)/Glu-tRNA(Gln) amidotransferase subunit GatC [Bacillota bacterium]HPT33855.1 Asp-tRNA(Asn)/Glu-tRNA(Gln) amidotransferase subunit GatC [Bacillota bacterium]HPZ65332.1 Asp-tRNA(Asn)/Glu-tRNA(Gln) amidotransferase subunit GatC [Bacillota bacterium]HQD06445.1 Asp-tRNA(Asn)/Glu-tRNA(Gln) amidotransferase subunit GatC [Bacillota bacterium]
MSPLSDYRSAVENAIRAIKIDFSPEEVEQLAADLARFQEWLAPLLAVETAGIEPLQYSFQGVNVLREDRPESGDLESLRRVAETFEGGYYRVPPVIE